jgi:formate hydrogenlyase subunit 6/NADH:ubiquinone oxidoreductase subunit I
MFRWFRNVFVAVSTLIQGMWVTLLTMLKTYQRKTFTHIYEYPEVPVPVKARYRGFHRYDLTTCIGCDSVLPHVRWTASTSTRRKPLLARDSV